jgi:hypothetical protein
MTDLLKVGSRFTIHGEPRTCNAFGTGNIHGTYLLVSADGDQTYRYILQRINTEVFKKPESVQDNIRRILTFLKDTPGNFHAFRNPEMVETLDGRLMYHDRREGYWRCFQYIEKSRTLETVESPEQAFEGARGFGIFAASLINYNPRRLHVTIPHFMDAEWRNRQLAYAELTNPGERLKTAQPELKRFRELSYIPEQFIRIRSALPDRVTHNDTKITNVLFDQETFKAIGVIDLDTVMTGTLLTDFGDMVRSFTASGKEDEAGPEGTVCREDIFGGLAAGFLEAVSPFIADVEKSNLLLGAKAVIYMQAIRFLTDYLNGDTYYRTSYPEQNLFRTRNQLGLLESLLSKEDRLKGILDKSF